MPLEGIGIFKVEAAIPEVTDNEKPVIFPPNAVSFEYDSKVRENDDLVNFIVEHTRKIKPLASADLNSFLTLGRQFLNIGKPFTIQNLGTLDKIKSGDLEFRQGQVILQKMEAPRDITENNVEENDADNLFNDYQSAAPGNGKSVVVSVVVVLILGLCGWAVWSLFFKNDKPETPSSELIIPIADSTPLQSDTSAQFLQMTDSSNYNKPAKSDSVGFNIVVQTFTNRRIALARLAKLERFGRNVIMYTEDSLTYKIAHPFALPLSDTTRMLDSLNRYYYQGKAKLELK